MIYFCEVLGTVFLSVLVTVSVRSSFLSVLVTVSVRSGFLSVLVTLSLRTADAFSVVASLSPKNIFRRERSDDRKCVCCSQARSH